VTALAHVVSKDGTRIGYTRTGNGPAVVLVDGALSYRGSSLNDGLARALAPEFTVYTYDRRGRGESGDTRPFAVERELEDLGAIVAAAGGRARLYGISSGGALVLEAGARLAGIEEVAVYELPLVVDGERQPVPPDAAAHTRELLAAGRRAEAVSYFMRDGSNLPGWIVAIMHLMPAWGRLKAVAHTLPYDLELMDGLQAGKPLPRGRWDLQVPALVMGGGKSPAWLRNGTRALADNLGAEHRTLEGQRHIVKAEAVAPAVSEFFSRPG